MDTAQALLVLAGVLLIGLVVLTWVTHRRISRMQAALEMLEQLPALAERLDVLGARVERPEFSAALSAKLTEVAESHARLAAVVTELGQRIAGAPPQANEPEGDDLGAVVRRHLQRQGFEPVRILTDLDELDGRAGRVVFEARLLGAVHKGHVVLEDGQVVDQEVRAAYSAFP